MDYFSYGDQELNHLKERDPALGKAIDLIGPIKRAVTRDLFTSLADCILGQQISSKAHRTVYGRALALFGENGLLSSARMAAASPEEIKSVGISMRKAEYIRGAAERFSSGEYSPSDLALLSDEEFISRVSSLKGVGRWTCEMLLLFCLERKDVISYLDLGIRRGMCLLYEKDSLTKEEFFQYREAYRPYASVASLYLWELASGQISLH